MASSLIEDAGRDLQNSSIPCENTTIVGNGEDVALLSEAGNISKIFYSKELLMKLKNHPASVRKPECLDSLHMVTKAGKWDPEHWMSNNANKRQTSSTTGNDESKKRDESDNFSFTPQRRSFVTGCQVSRRQETEAMAMPLLTEKERRPPVTRSIREREFPSKAQFGERDTRKFPTRSGYEREGNRYHRVNGHNERQRFEETPEWFSGGPTSQNETIELKGFDEESGKLKRKSEAKKIANGQADSEQEQKKPNDNVEEAKKEPEFNLDALLSMEPAGFNGLDWETSQSDPAVLQGSKFSRWFKKPEEPQAKDAAPVNDKEDAAKSLLEIMHKGNEQMPQPKTQAVRTAEEVEKMAKREALADLMTSLTSSAPRNAQKDPAPASRPMTEQDLLASLLGEKMNVATAQQQQKQPTEDILVKFLQTAQSQTAKKPEQIQQQIPVPALPNLQQRPDIQAMLRNAAAAAAFTGLPTVEQLEFLAKQRQLVQQQHTQQLQQQQNVAKTSSASTLAFTPTAVMRKMTADKDKEKTNKSQAVDKAGSSRPKENAPSQMQGSELLTNQAAAVTNFAGLPLQRLPSQPMPPPLTNPFPGLMNPQNVMNSVALRLLEQQQQQQLLARIVATSVAQNQYKQQRISPLQQQGLLPIPGIGGPLMPGNHFRPIHPQPAMPPPGPGYAPFMAGPIGAAGQQPKRMPGLREPLPNVNLQQQMAALHAQRMNALPGNRPLGPVQQMRDLPQPGTANP